MREQMPAAWENMFAWKRTILAETASLPQVRLHDFQGYKPMVSDPEHYVDMVHFDRLAHRLLFLEIRSGREVATEARLSKTEAFLRIRRRRQPWNLC